jgi:RNA polymerase sigma-70 factor (ECF subfamily)
MDDEQQTGVAQGLREGKVEAWHALYDAYAQPIWRLVARLMGPSSADVADVVQETFIAAAQSAASFDPSRGSLWVWLCGIARRHVALHYRKEEQRRRLRAACEQLHAPDGRILDRLDRREPLPDEALATVELATLVRATLAQLPDDYESLLAAKYMDGVPVDEIARTKDLSDTAVRSKLSRARRAFREVFAALGGADHR